MAGMFDGIFAGAFGVAGSLLGTLGISATVKLRPDTTYDPGTGNEAELIPAEITVKAAPPESYSIREIDNSNILTGDIKTTIGSYDLDFANVTKEELERAELIINNEALRIVIANPLISGNDIAAYELQLRR